MLLPILTLSMAAAGVAWPPPDAIEWTAAYDATVLPGDAEPYWRPYEGADTSATLEDEGLRIVDTSSTQGSMRSFRRSWHVDPAQGAAVEARIRLVTNNSRGGAHLMAADGEHEVLLTLYPDRIVAGEDDLACAMDTTDGFHVYRLAIRGGDFLVWVDGALAIDGTGKHTRPAYSGRNCVAFGAGSSTAQSEMVYAYVRYAVFGELPMPERVAGAEDVIIFKERDVYACFPSLYRLDDGTLATSFGTRARRSHIDPTGGSACYVSKDQGHTWERLEGSRPTDPRLRCKDGSLVVASSYGWREVPEERRGEFQEKGITVRDVRPGVVAYLQGAYVRRSTDDGKTWQTEDIALPPHRSMMHFNGSDRCTLSNGVRLSSVYGKLQGEEVSRTFVLRSDDDGKTWEFLPLAADPNGEVALNETALAENAEGEVIAMMRAEPPNGGYLYCSTSNDSGRTWTEPRRTDLWGYPAHLLRLQDGRMLCTYGYRRHAMGVRAAISDDGGHTWDAGKVVVIRCDGDGAGGDLGYPLSIETAPGDIFTIYYITTADGITHVAGTHWQAPSPTP